MDISVRSPHGDADVSIVAADTTTVGDVVAAVTGQAVPSIVDVDGRPVPSASRLAESPVRTGSVVSTEPVDVPDRAPLRLVQLAGRGTGRSAPLTHGRYRLGPGRRLHDHELRVAPVESTAFELEVRTDGDVHVTAVADDVRIDGAVGGGRLRVGDGVVSTTTRAFVLDTSGSDDGDRLDGHAGPDGTVTVNRPGRVETATTARRPVVDALAAARHRSVTLWGRRPGDDDAFTASVGVTVDDGVRTVTIPLRTTADTVDGVGIVGSEPVRSGLARTVLAELATAHSPADLRLVVVTRRPETWEWAKWLPHLRDSGRRLVIGAGDLSAVVDDRTTTVVVVDDPADWTHADAPLRGRWAALPATTSVVALCSTRSEVPAICTTTIDEHRNGRVSVTGRRRAGVDDVIPALVDAETAELLARCLAPLVDVDEIDEQPPTTGWTGICGLPPKPGVGDLRDRWSSVDADAPSPLTVVRSASLQTALDVAAGLVVGRAVQHPPDRLRILPVTDRDSALHRLPHSDTALGIEDAVGHPTLAAVGVDRLEQRLRSVLADPTGADEVLLVVEVGRDDAGRPDETGLELAARAGDGVSVIVATDALDLPLPDVTTTVTVDESTTHIRLRFTEPDGDRVLVIAHGGASTLQLRPFRLGRRTTDAERRIDRHRARRIDPELERLVTLANDAAPDAVTGRPLAPPPPPERLDLDGLLDRHPGDGLPLGEVDRPDLDADPPWWWQPGQGSVIAIGGEGSAASRLVDTVLAGVSARFGDGDVALVAFTSTDERRDTAAALPHTRVASRLDDVDAGVLERVEHLRRDRSRPVVVLVDDLAGWHRTVGEDGHLDEWGRHGDVVATAHSATEIEELLPSFAHRLLGPTDGATDAALLGIRRPPTALGDVVEAGSDTVVHLGVPRGPRPGERPAPEASL